METRFQADDSSKNAGGIHKTERLSNQFRAYRQTHRKAVTVTAIMVVATAFMAPLVAQAATQNQDDAVRSDNSRGSGTGATYNSLDAPQHDEKIKPSTGSPSDNSSSQTGSSDSSQNTHKSEVTVNGESIPVPDNGSYNKTVKDGNSTTNIKVESNHNSTSNGNSTSNSSSSSVKLNVQSESHSSSSP